MKLDWSRNGIAVLFKKMSECFSLLPHHFFFGELVKRRRCGYIVAYV